MSSFEKKDGMKIHEIEQNFKSTVWNYYTRLTHAILKYE